MVLYILLTLNVKINCAKNYDNVLNVVKVMPNILVVTGTLFPDTVYITHYLDRTIFCTD